MLRALHASRHYKLKFISNPKNVENYFDSADFDHY